MRKITVYISVIVLAVFASVSLPFNVQSADAAEQLSNATENASAEKLVLDQSGAAASLDQPDLAASANFPAEVALANSADKYCSDDTSSPYSFQKSRYDVIKGYSVVLKLLKNGSTNTDLVSNVTVYTNPTGSRSVTYNIGASIRNNSEIVITGYQYGFYEVRATLASGQTAWVLVAVTPGKASVSGASAISTYKNITMTVPAWTGPDYCAVYLNGKYKGNARSASFAITSGLKAGTTYKVQLLAVKEAAYKGKTYALYSSKSSVVKVFTASKSKPKIKRVKAIKTKYIKPVKIWQPAYWDAGGVYHAGYYYTTSAKSTAYFKVYHTKVKGVSGYQSNSADLNYRKGLIHYTFSGKIKAKVTTVKVRTYKKSGCCTAWGPWSKVKKVRSKRAK